LNHQGAKEKRCTKKELAGKEKKTPSRLCGKKDNYKIKRIKAKF
jgi:hypothetical protein